ncbi:MAG: hypothetical protein ACOC37_01040 [Spirochaetota bacterium]
MTPVRRLLATLLLMLTLAAGAWAQSRVTLSLGHAGAVRALAGRGDVNLAFSGGEDGRLTVWDLEHGGLRTSWQVAHVALTRVAVHPTRAEVVVFARPAERRAADRDQLGDRRTAV